MVRIKPITAEQCPKTEEKAEAILAAADALVRNPFMYVVVNQNKVMLYAGGDMTIISPTGAEIELGNAKGKEVDKLIDLLPRLVNCVRGI